MKNSKKISIILILLLSINMIFPIMRTNAVPLLITYSDYATFKNDLQALSYPLSISVNGSTKQPNMSTYNKYKLVVYGSLGEYSAKKDINGEYEYLGWNRNSTPQPNSKYADSGYGKDNFNTATYVTTDMGGTNISAQATRSWSEVATTEYSEYNKSARLFYNGSYIGLSVNNIGTDRATLYQQATLINDGSVRVYLTDRDGTNKRYATLTIPSIPYQNVLQGSILTGSTSYVMKENDNSLGIDLQANAKIITNSSDGTDKFFKTAYVNTLTAKITSVEVNGKEIYSAYAKPPTFDDNAYGIMSSHTFYTVSPQKTLVLNRNLFTTGTAQTVKIKGYMAYATLQGKTHTIFKENLVTVKVDPKNGRLLKVNYIDSSTGNSIATSQTITVTSDANVIAPKQTISGYTPMKYKNITTGAEEIYNSSKTYSESVSEGQNVEVSYIYDKQDSTAPTPTVTASTSPSELKTDIGTVKVDVITNGIVNNYTSSTTPKITNLALHCEPKGEGGKGQTYNLSGSNANAQKTFTFDIDTKGKSNNQKQEFDITFTVTFANGTTAKATTTTDLIFKSDSNIALSVIGNTRNNKYQTGDMVKIEVQSTGTIENKFDEATQSVILYVKQMPVGWTIGDSKTYITAKSKLRSSQVLANSTGAIDGSYADFTFEVRADNQTYTQYFEMTLATMIKNKVYTETKYISAEIYKDTPPVVTNVNKPNATVNVDNTVFVDTLVPLSGFGNDIDKDDKLIGALMLDGIQIDSKQSDNNSIYLSKNLSFSQEGKHNLSMYVIDQGGNSAIDSKDFQVVVPTPTIVVKTNRTYHQLGDVKANRKFNIDISSSYAGSSSANINWNKTIWKVEPYQNLSKEDIKTKQSTAIDGDKPYPQSFSALSKKEGKYKVTVTIENNYGRTDTKELLVDVSPDIAPIAHLISDKSILRDPATGYATFNLMDNSNNGTGEYSVSNDYDTIEKRAWVYAYDDNGNGSYTDDKWYIYNASSKTWMLIANNLEDLLKKDVFSDIYSCGNENNVQVISKYVGDYRFGLFVKEGYGQPTISEFVTTEDYLTNDTLNVK